MATIKFFTRTITKDKNALVPIYVRIKSGRKIDLVCKADLLIKPENWSNETQKANQRADAFKFYSGDSKDEQKGRQKFNEKITELRSYLESEVMQVHQEEITSEWLKKIIDKHWHPDKYKTSLFSFIRAFIDKSETKSNPKTGRPVSYKMRREYEVTFKYLQDYAAEKKIVIDFKDIDLNFYDGFVQYLQNVPTDKTSISTKTKTKTDHPEVQKEESKKLAVNTIGKKIQTLKIFLNAAKEEGKNTFEAYRSKKFIATTEESETIYLNEAELAKIYEHDFRKNTTVEQIRDLFLIGAWTGCRFSDIAQITQESISDGFIHLMQYKTGKRVLIPLHPVVTAILHKYNGKLPAATTNQQFNRALKDIAEAAGISEMTHKAITKGGVKVSTAYKKHKLVTTHTARRSFATNLYKSGFPSISIMAITGHVTEKSFLKYIQVTPDEHAKNLLVHWDNRHLKVV
jgi:integrase